VEQVDDDDDNEEGGNELVFDNDPTFNWATSYETSIIYTRRQATNKRKQPSSGGNVIRSSHASKKGSGKTSTPTRRGKKKIQIGVENELHDSFDYEFEKLLNIEKSFSKGEVEEGYAPLDNIEDNYVGIKERVIYN